LARNPIFERFLMPAPHPIRRESSDPEDPRLAEVVREGWEDGTQVALIGAPFDEGVRAGGGRVGAAGGPAAVREQLCRYGTLHHLEFGVSLEGLRIADLGDVAAGSGSGEEVYAALTAVVAEVARRGAVAVVLGGGHDLTFAGVRGLAVGSAVVGGVNVDAHLDVRPFTGGTMSSGMPYRRLLEEVGAFRGERLVELGIQGFSSAAAHAEYVQAHGGTILPLRQVREMGAAAAMERALRVAEAEGADLFVSIDIDSAAQAFAPGCSAPSPDGFTPADLIGFAYAAGGHARLRYFDVMEVNPAFDLDHRTARLAAALVIAFLGGYASRAEGRGA
jgi:formimidoylglutamase